MIRVELVKYYCHCFAQTFQHVEITEFDKQLFRIKAVGYVLIVMPQSLLRIPIRVCDYYA